MEYSSLVGRLMSGEYKEAISYDRDGTANEIISSKKIGSVLLLTQDKNRVMPVVEGDIAVEGNKVVLKQPQGVRLEIVI